MIYIYIYIYKWLLRSANIPSFYFGTALQELFGDDMIPQLEAFLAQHRAEEQKKKDAKAEKTKASASTPTSSTASTAAAATEGDKADGGDDAAKDDKDDDEEEESTDAPPAKKLKTDHDAEPADGGEGVGETKASAPEAAAAPEAATEAAPVVDPSAPIEAAREGGDEPTAMAMEE